MALDTDLERTEAATPQRREEARKEGRIPRSQELNTAVGLLGAAILLKTLGVAVGQGVAQLFGYGLASLGEADMAPGQLIRLVQEVGWMALGTSSVLLLSLAGVSFAVAGVQGRGVLTARPLEPKLSRLEPVHNAKRLFGMRLCAELVKSLVKLAVIVLAVRWALAAAWPEILLLVQQSPVAALDVVHRYAVRMLLIAGGTYLGLGLLDYGYQIWQHERDLRMTKDEIKRELKQGEIDPLVKQRMHSAARERIRSPASV